jgi:hypothetical protein
VAGYKRKRGKAKKDDLFHDGIQRFDTLTEQERAALQGDPDLRRIYCDPGRRDLITMVDDEDGFCRYSNGRRIHETKRMTYARKSGRRLAAMGVDGSGEAAELCRTTCTTNDRGEFLAYVQAKIAYERRFRAGYRQECHRSYRWHQYVERQRADTKLVRHVRDYVGDPAKAAIFYGDWSTTHQLQRMMPTPCLRIRRLIAKAFPRIYLLDEFRTSRLYWRDPNIRVEPHVTRTERRPEPFAIHSLLTLNGDDIEDRMDANGTTLWPDDVFINRDKNAARNMRAIVQHQLVTGERPAPFRRAGRW